MYISIAVSLELGLVGCIDVFSLPLVKTPFQVYRDVRPLYDGQSGNFEHFSLESDSRDPGQI